MSKTLQQKLNEVDDAISAIMTGGQEVRSRTGSVTMADLSVLRKERAQLQQEIERQSSGGGGLVACVFDGRD